jgi:hypothetical protein
LHCTGRVGDNNAGMRFWPSGRLPAKDFKRPHSSNWESPLFESDTNVSSTFSQAGSSGNCFMSGKSTTMRCLVRLARLTSHVSSSTCWTITAERAGSSGGITSRRRASRTVAVMVGISHKPAECPANCHKSQRIGTVRRRGRSPVGTDAGNTIHSRAGRGGPTRRETFFGPNPYSKVYFHRCERIGTHCDLNHCVRRICVQN